MRVCVREKQSSSLLSVVGFRLYLLYDTVNIAGVDSKRVAGYTHTHSECEKKREMFN